jgi:DNA (cytosine-5)-methyltransferase 1
MTTAAWSQKSAVDSPIPVVDLFAGPGGLGEGFSSVADQSGKKVFSVRVSIEKDPVAHKTLTLRAFFRMFGSGQAPDAYYDYLRGDISRFELFSAYPYESEEARAEARLATLGETPEPNIDSWIRDAVGTENHWVLIGGPPCQAYSVAGRSRRRPVDAEGFKNDERHLLYRQYLRIIEKFRPPIFVMENVKGILTSNHEGGKIFGKILADLSSPSTGLDYSIRSFAVAGSSGELAPEDYILRSENYGIPQTRHRVILLGVRSDLASLPHQLLLTKPPVSVWDTIGTLPRVRSRLSREDDSHEKWLQAIKETPRFLASCTYSVREAVEPKIMAMTVRAADIPRTGTRFIQRSRLSFKKMPADLAAWLRDERLDGVCQHETRSHMRSDLHRYLYASCFAKVFDRTPMLRDYPEKLLPDHVNIRAKTTPFLDRFRVQIGSLPSTTVVSHISKDGHYYIHPDPAQCRSLTVREAARLQTFPDNYFFEGNRTEQYVQVGNAVPPLLATQLGKVVFDLLSRSATSINPNVDDRFGRDVER